MMPAMLDSGLDAGSGAASNTLSADDDALLLSRFAAGDQGAARILTAQLLPG